MITTHHLTITAICPVDGSRDIYAMTVRSTAIVMVEEILAAVNAVTGAPIYQEELTQQLADVLKTEVETEGRHSGVETRCVAQAAA